MAKVRIISEISVTTKESFHAPKHCHSRNLRTSCAHAVFVAKSICKDIRLIKRGVLLIKLIAVLREKHVSKASLAALGRVGRRRLKLICNVIIGRKSFTAVLHLREQL